jgi:hypothetical protein
MDTFFVCGYILRVTIFGSFESIALRIPEFVGDAAVC